MYHKKYQEIQFGLKEPDLAKWDSISLSRLFGFQNAVRNFKKF